MVNNTEIVVLVKINKMLKDNYGILFLFAILIIVFAYIFVYFLIEVIKVVIKFYKNRKIPKMEKTDDDDENYLFDPNDMIDPSMFIDKNKRDYLDNIENSSANYNSEKEQWIKNQFGNKVEIDKINDDILYRKHDNYIYDNND